MADYKRMVSYMYQYENGIKKRNIGYARVESRNGKCRITLRLRLTGLVDGIFPTYMIQRKHGDMELIYIGDSVLKNQGINSRLETNASNIRGSNYSLEDMGGILLFLNEKVFFATEWDDKPVVLEEVLEALKEKDEPEEDIIVEAANEAVEEEEEIEEVAEAVEEEEEIEEVAEAVEEEEEIEEVAEAVEVEEEAEEADETVSQTNKPWDSVPVYKMPRGWKTIERTFQAKKEIKPKPSQEVEQESVPEVKPKSRAPRRSEEHPTAEKLFNKNQRIYPFEDSDITMCVKIEPKDIGLLPAEMWTLSNNSFLLHGFYCYNHLIFAKLVDGCGSRYILGVPGIYHNRERFMARMFGFEHFKSIRKQGLNQGDFGYWYIAVNL